jgi:hypothetical protein
MANDGRRSRERRDGTESAEPPSLLFNVDGSRR